MALFKKKKIVGVLYSENGDFIKKVDIPNEESYFKYKGRTYNLISDKSSYLDEKGLFYDKRLYFYNIINSNPFLFDKKYKPILESDVYNALLETKVIKDINDYSKGNFLSGLFSNPKQILIIVCIIIALYYILSQGII